MFHIFPHLATNFHFFAKIFHHFRKSPHFRVFSAIFHDILKFPCFSAFFSSLSLGVPIFSIFFVFTYVTIQAKFAFTNIFSRLSTRCNSMMANYPNSFPRVVSETKFFHASATLNGYFKNLQFLSFFFDLLVDCIISPAQSLGRSANKSSKIVKSYWHANEKLVNKI